MSEARVSARSPWAWIPTLYLAEGLPYVVVMTVSVRGANRRVIPP